MANGRAGQGARRMAPGVEPAARVGCGAKGVVYLIVGILAARAALGTGGRVGDSRDALGVIIEQPLGRVLLGVVTAGLFGYVLWSLVSAATDAEGHGSDAKGIAVRVASVLRALVYGALGMEALRLTMGRGGSGGGGEQSQHWVARVLDLPFGRWLVAAAGAALAAYAAQQLWAAASNTIRHHLDLRGVDTTTARWAMGLGRFGIAARAVVFGVVAWLLLRAALHERAQEAGGMAEALQVLRAGAGPWLLGGVAFGFVAYGAYQLIHARYRRISV